MIPAGALVKQVFLPPAAHPHEGPYAKLHTCSIPNPILMAGTIFIDERTVTINEQFFPKQTTAFAVNAIDYRSLLRNYHYVYQKAGQDAEAAQAGLKFMEMGRPAFLSVHLQDSGEGGVASMWAAPGAPWKNDIWQPDSPYRKNLLNADRLLGDFIQGLAKLGLLETTAFVVVGDHGQADTGWHPLELWDPAITTAVLWGAGIAPKAVIDYAELIDIGPTICVLMDVGPPPTALGTIIGDAIPGDLSVERPGPGPRPRLQEKMNAQFRDFRVLKARTWMRSSRTPRGPVRAGTIPGSTISPGTSTASSGSSNGRGSRRWRSSLSRTARRSKTSRNSPARFLPPPPK